MKKNCYLMSLLALLMIFTACAQQAPADAAVGSGEPVMNVAFVVHADNSSFYVRKMDGARDAGRDLNVQVSIMAPGTPYDVTEQINIIETAIQAGYDAIATTAPDPAFRRILDDAAAAGVPVIIYNSGDPEAASLAFVGQDLEASGYVLATYFFENVLNGSGNVLIATCAPDNPALIARMDGMRRAAENFPGINVYDEPLNYTADMSIAAGLIEASIIAHPDLDGILSTDVFVDTVGTVVNSMGLAGDVFVGGFDLTENTLSLIEQGIIQVTIGQNPYLQGYYPIVMFYLQHTAGYAPVDINTGAFLVNSDNVADVQPE